MTSGDNSGRELDAAISGAYPWLEGVAGAAEQPVYLVGGAVRDLLLDRPGSDVDLVVEGDAAAFAARLGAAPTGHERFGTAKVRLDGHEVDVAAARRESYPRPGALPVVAPAASIEEDLGRRDFTINAMAVPLRPPRRLIDPHGGEADLAAGLLRVLHPGSFVDDPTRALRAARYAARFGLALEPETERLLRAADLGTVSADRRRAELLRLAAEATAVSGLALLADWGLIEPRADGLELAARAQALLRADPWSGFASPRIAILTAALGSSVLDPPGAGGDDRSEDLLARAEALAAAVPARPSEAVELARGRDPVELTLARALGGEWLDRYLEQWRQVTLEIDGADLLAAGIPQGPALGRGLAAALAAKLDGEAAGREAELAVALAAANE